MQPKNSKPKTIKLQSWGSWAAVKRKKTKEEMLPYYHLFARDFNSANLEQKYFAGLKFRESSTLELGF